jgi:hypothetical protein
MPNNGEENEQMPNGGSMKPIVTLIGEDGNVFSIIGIVARALKKVGQADKAKEFTEKAFAAHSYDEVLAMLSEYVEVE